MSVFLDSIQQILSKLHWALDKMKKFLIQKMRHDGISVESSWEILIFNRIEVWVCFFFSVHSLYFSQFFRWIIVAIWIVSHNNTNVLKLNRKLQVVRRYTSSVYSKNMVNGTVECNKNKQVFVKFPSTEFKWSDLNSHWTLARMLPTLFHIIITVSRF